MLAQQHLISTKNSKPKNSQDINKEITFMGAL